MPPGTDRMQRSRLPPSVSEPMHSVQGIGEAKLGLRSIPPLLPTRPKTENPSPSPSGRAQRTRLIASPLSWRERSAARSVAGEEGRVSAGNVITPTLALPHHEGGGNSGWTSLLTRPCSAVCPGCPGGILQRTRSIVSPLPRRERSAARSVAGGEGQDLGRQCHHPHPNPPPS